MSAMLFPFFRFPTQVTRDPQIIRNADAIVLPGVGAFRDAIANLKKYDLVDLLKEEAMTGKPFLGICLGMQVLFERAMKTENGTVWA